MSPTVHDFAIGFDPRDRARLHALWDEVIDSGQWSHGPMNRRFEEAWAAWNGAGAVALGSWSGAAVVDCNRDDLCLSFADFERRLAAHRPRAVVLVHIGGHLAFETRRIAEACRAEGVFLLEDCAHAHCASWDGERPGTFGDAGADSLDSSSPPASRGGVEDGDARAGRTLAQLVGQHRSGDVVARADRRGEDRDARRPQTGVTGLCFAGHRRALPAHSA